MNTDGKIWRGVRPISGPSKKRPGRNFTVKAADVTTSEQAEPVPVAYGRVISAGTHISPTFNIKRHTYSSSKKGGADATNYAGSAAIALNIGPTNILHSIRNGETVIWQGPLSSSSRDSEGKTILGTTLGNIHFFWGYPDQEISSIFAGLKIDFGDGLGPVLVDVPGMPRLCYAVFDVIRFGDHSAPPILRFERSVWVNPAGVALPLRSIRLGNGGSGYTSAPTVTITGGGGTGATATATLGPTGLKSITIVDKGTNITPDGIHDLVFTGGGGTGAAGRVHVSQARVIKVTLDDPGTGYTSPPTITLELPAVEPPILEATLLPRSIISLTLTNPGSGYTYDPDVEITGGGGSGAIGYASRGNVVEDDVQVPDVILDILLDRFTWLGADPADIDLDSFAAASATLADEGQGISGIIDTATPAREHIGKLLQYVDGYICRRNGNITIGLVRDTSTEGLPVLDENDLTDEPKPSSDGVDSLYGTTRVVWTDRANEWSNASEQYDDPAIAAYLGETVEQEFQMPFIARQSVAQAVARRLSFKGGFPALIWEVRALPSYRTLQPGDRFFLSFAKLGISNLLLRVNEIEIGGPADLEVVLRCIEERFPFPEENHFVPDIPPPPVTLPLEILPAGPRLSWLPDPLKGAAPDGVLVAINKTDPALLKGDIFWTYDPTLVDYHLLATFDRFPAKAKVLCWHRIRGTNWLLRMSMDTDEDFDRLVELLTTSTGTWGFLGIRLVRTVGTLKDEHQVMAAWMDCIFAGYFNVLGTDLVDLEVRVLYGTDFLLEEEGNDSIMPAVDAFFGLESDFAIVPSSTLQFERNAANAVDDADLKRYLKVATKTADTAEALADVEAVVYDRDDPAMCPDGTYSRTWGRRARTTYEVFDRAAGPKVENVSGPQYELLADIDAALGRRYAGTPSAVQDLLTADIDRVLGNKVALALNTYGP